MANPNLSNEQFRQILGATTRPLWMTDDPSVLHIHAEKGGSSHDEPPRRMAPYPTTEIAAALTSQPAQRN